MGHRPRVSRELPSELQRPQSPVSAKAVSTVTASPRFPAGCRRGRGEAHSGQNAIPCPRQAPGSHQRQPWCCDPPRPYSVLGISKPWMARWILVPSGAEIHTCLLQKPRDRVHSLRRSPAVPRSPHGFRVGVRVFVYQTPGKVPQT